MSFDTLPDPADVVAPDAPASPLAALDRRPLGLHLYWTPGHPLWLRFAQIRAKRDGAGGWVNVLGPERISYTGRFDAVLSDFIDVEAGKAYEIRFWTEAVTSPLEVVAAISDGDRYVRFGGKAPAEPDAVKPSERWAYQGTFTPSSADATA